MTKWLPDNEENKLPEYANQFLGMARFVCSFIDHVLFIMQQISVSVFGGLI